MQLLTTLLLNRKHIICSNVYVHTHPCISYGLCRQFTGHENREDYMRLVKFESQCGLEPKREVCRIFVIISYPSNVHYEHATTTAGAWV